MHAQEHVCAQASAWLHTCGATQRRKLQAHRHHHTAAELASAQAHQRNQLVWPHTQVEHVTRPHVCRHAGTRTAREHTQRTRSWLLHNAGELLLLVLGHRTALLLAAAVHLAARLTAATVEAHSHGVELERDDALSLSTRQQAQLHTQVTVAGESMCGLRASAASASRD